jgi:integration host factor subunit beta
MNRSELIESVASRARVPRKDAEKVVKRIFDLLFDAIVRGDRIEIRGLGSFVVKKYGAYVGRNPRTGASIQVEPKRLPFFKVGKELKERVDGKVTAGSPATAPAASTPTTEG